MMYWKRISTQKRTQNTKYHVHIFMYVRSRKKYSKVGKDEKKGIRRPDSRFVAPVTRSSMEVIYFTKLHSK